jgi:hypothetical protein
MLAGAAIGGALGGGSILGGNILAKGAARLAEPVAGLVGRTKRTMGNLVGENRSLSAAAADGGVAFEGSEPILSGMTRGMGLDELSADLGIGRLGTRSERRMLETASPEEFAAAKSMREKEQLFASNIIGDTALGGVTGTRANARLGLNRLVSREVGMPNTDQFTQTATNAARKETSKVFNESFEAAGDLRFEADDLAKFDEAVLQSSADGRPQVEAVINDIKADMTPEGVLPNDKAVATRNRLTKYMDGAGSDMPRRQALEDVREALDDIIERQAVLKDPGVAEALAEARYRWRILSSLEAPGAVDAGGDINIRSFSNAMKRHGNKGLRRTRMNERGRQFAEHLETLDFLSQKVVPSSGTAERLIASTMNTLTGPAAIGAGAATLGGMLFGR